MYKTLSRRVAVVVSGASLLFGCAAEMQNQPAPSPSQAPPAVAIAPASTANQSSNSSTPASRPTSQPWEIVTPVPPLTPQVLAELHGRKVLPTTRPRTLRIRGASTRPDDWYKSREGKRVADNVVGWQNANGGWFKNYDPRKPRPATVPDVPNLGPPGDSDKIWHQVSTFDNDATWSEMRILGRAYRVLGKPAYKKAFDRGLNYILTAQYPNGGFPQRYPLQDNYGRYITINDDAMLGPVSLLKDIADQKPDFAFATPEQRAKALAAYQKGVDCFLKCQIVVDGKPTVWCQQHDEVTFEPRGGRTFELPSFISEESQNIVVFLMTIKHPDARLRASINGAMDWFESHKILGKIYLQVAAPGTQRGHDRILLDDDTASPLWARFYDLKTAKPIFVSRDGIPKWSVDQISYERRNGYDWLDTWPTEAEKAYVEWKTENPN